MSCLSPLLVLFIGSRPSCGGQDESMVGAYSTAVAPGLERGILPNLMHVLIVRATAT